MQPVIYKNHVLQRSGTHMCRLSYVAEQTQVAPKREVSDPLRYVELCHQGEFTLIAGSFLRFPERLCCTGLVRTVHHVPIHAHRKSA